MIPQPRTDQLLRRYFFLWKTKAQIVNILSIRHNIHVSLPWIWKRLKFLNMCRRSIYNDPVQYNNAVQAIKQELSTPNSLRGYRAMWEILRVKYAIFIPRECVRNMLLLLDPAGCNCRKKRTLKRRVYITKGPNYVWHLDGNDKLGVKYGFYIHGCIDGYSRKMLWLQLTPTNSDPRVVVSYYIESVLQAGGCPRIVRSDYGTENCLLASAQMALRHDHHDIFAGSSSYRYGKSTTNTRIEGWWSRLKRFNLQWWIDKFEELIDLGVYDPNNAINRHCLAFCAVHLLNESLSEFMHHWDNHRMRKTRGSVCPGGIPYELFDCFDGSTNYICKPLNMPVILAIIREYCDDPPGFYPDSFSRAASHILQNDLHMLQNDITMENFQLIYIYLHDYFK